MPPYGEHFTGSSKSYSSVSSSSCSSYYEDCYELWWATGDMDDTMVYTHEGVEYLVNGINKYPLFAPEDFGEPTENDDIYDPYRHLDGGNVTGRAFKRVSTTDAAPFTYGVSYEQFDGDTLVVSVPKGDPVPDLDPLTGRNWCGGDDVNDWSNHYWKKVPCCH